jgi:hypothetical protein
MSSGKLRQKVNFMLPEMTRAFFLSGIGVMINKGVFFSARERMKSIDEWSARRREVGYILHGKWMCLIDQ